MRSPLNKAYRVSSKYGSRILGGNPDFHNGIDLVPLDGNHPCDLFATVDGTVTGVRSNVPDSHTGLGVKSMVTGNYINIRTKEGYTIIYRHLKAGSVAVKLNQQVKSGDKIGVMGTTGQSTGVHLHFEIRDTQYLSVNPAMYLDNDVQLPATSKSEQVTVHYSVKVQAVLNIRKGAGTNFAVVDTIRDNGVYAIVAESDGTGAKKWGKLQNGKGWIALEFTERVGEPAGLVRLGSRVRVKQGAKSYTGGGVSAFVYNNTYTVDTLNGDRAVLDSRGLCTPFHLRDLLVV